MQIEDLIQQTSEIEVAIPIRDNFNLIFWSLMAFNLIVIAMVSSFNRGYLRTLFSTALHNRQLINKLREDLDLSKFTSIILNVTYFNSLAIIVWLVSNSEQNYFILIILLFLIIAAALKLATVLTVSFIANTRVGLHEHLLNHLIFFQIGGVVLTPILIFTHYIPESYEQILLITLILIICLFLVAREFQSLIRALQYKISIFYIILYLCTLELLPFAVGVRVFILNSEVLN